MSSILMLLLIIINKALVIGTNKMSKSTLLQTLLAQSEHNPHLSSYSGGCYVKPAITEK